MSVIKLSVVYKFINNVNEKYYAKILKLNRILLLMGDLKLKLWGIDLNILMLLITYSEIYVELHEWFCVRFKESRQWIKMI